jgi:hypothetical protein
VPRLTRPCSGRAQRLDCATPPARRSEDRPRERRVCSHLMMNQQHGGTPARTYETPCVRRPGGKRFRRSVKVSPACQVYTHRRSEPVKKSHQPRHRLRSGRSPVPVAGPRCEGPAGRVRRELREFARSPEPSRAVRRSASATSTGHSARPQSVPLESIATSSQALQAVTFQQVPSDRLLRAAEHVGPAGPPGPG